MSASLRIFESRLKPRTKNNGVNQDFGVAEAFGAGLAAFFSVAPSFTVFASRVPSGFFQYEPLTSSLPTMSVIVPAAAPFVMVVLSVTLKTRVDVLPLIVNVLLV